MFCRDRLIILDADGTTIDAFHAIGKTFSAHGMDIGDLERFQKRRNLFKYLGGLKEFPKNLQKQLGKQKRSQLIKTLTEVYREEGRLYPGISELIRLLIDQPNIRIGIVTRNITHNPEETLFHLFARHGIDVKEMDFFVHLELKKEKGTYFNKIRIKYKINPARSFACGDEKNDYAAATSCGIHPIMVSYGFEDYTRLINKIGVPENIIAKTPWELRTRLFNAFDIDAGHLNNSKNEPVRLTGC